MRFRAGAVIKTPGGKERKIPFYPAKNNVLFSYNDFRVHSVLLGGFNAV